MQLSVIILNYNVKYFLDACIQSVQKAINAYDAEIIVADNASTDGSKTYFSGKYPDVKFLWFNSNDGFAKGNNLAVQQARGKYLLILNPDTLLAENAFDELFSFIKDKENFGIVGGKMIDGTAAFLPESKRGIPTPIAAFSKLTKLYKLLNFSPFNNYYQAKLKANESGKTPILTGAFMFIKKSVYDEVGGFDERYFMFGEDIDLSYTIQKSGRDNYYLPTAKIIHFKGESTQKDEKYIRRFVDTTFQFQEKHFRTFLPQKFLMQFFFKLWMKMRVKKAQNKQIDLSNKKICFVGNAQNFNKIKTQFSNAQLLGTMPDSIANSVLIFDTSAYGFKEIIDKMESLHNKQNHFRFYFPESQIILGSDAKDKLGEVLICK